MLDCVILAAGRSRRFGSKRPKPLQRLACAPMLDHVVKHARQLDPDRIVIVAPRDAETYPEFLAHVEETTILVKQEQALGTGDAVRCALPHLPGGKYLAVFYADTPLLPGQDCQDLLDKLRKLKAPLGVLGFSNQDRNHSYGRFVLDENDRIVGITEKGDDHYQNASHVCNAGFMVLDRTYAHKWLAQLPADPRTGEYYLTACIGLAHQAGVPGVYSLSEETKCLGVDHAGRLSQAESTWQEQRRCEIQQQHGVILVNPASVFLASDTEFRGSCTIEPHVYFGPGCILEEGVHIKAFSYLEGVHCHSGAQIGPFARVRGTSKIGKNGRVGCFVEVKNSHFEEEVKANHLSYIGDALVGQASNLGAGSITCNYDGVQKHRTTIGKRVFVGSNTSLIAPLELGDDVTVGAGSNLSGQVLAGSLALERAELKIIKNWKKRRKL